MNKMSSVAMAPAMTLYKEEGKTEKKYKIYLIKQMIIVMSQVIKMIENMFMVLLV